MGLVAWCLLLMVHSTPYSFHILPASRTCSGYQGGTQVYLFVCSLFCRPVLENFPQLRLCYSVCFCCFHALLFDFASVGMVFEATTNCVLPLSQYGHLSLPWFVLRSFRFGMRKQNGVIRLAWNIATDTMIHDMI